MKPPFENPLEKFDASRLTGQCGVPFNTLTCAHRFNGWKPLDVCRFLRQELDSTYIQFIPIVEFKGFERRVETLRLVSNLFEQPQGRYRTYPFIYVTPTLGFLFQKNVPAGATKPAASRWDEAGRRR